MKTFDTPGPIAVRVEHGIGNLRVRAEPRGDAAVTVRPTDPTKKGDVAEAEQTRVDFDAGRLVVRTPKGHKRWTPWSGRESVDVDLAVPLGSSLSVDGGVLAVHTSGRLTDVEITIGMGEVDIAEAGPLRVKTGMGDVVVREAAGEADIKTGMGRVDIHSVAGRATVKNSNGDTRIGQAEGEVRVQSANGTIAVDRTASAVVAKTSMGDIRVGSVARGAVDAQTAYGQIEVGVLEGTAAWLDLHTSFGHVRSELHSAGEPGPGEQTAEVRAHTSMGDITVRRIAPALLQ